MKTVGTPSIPGTVLFSVATVLALGSGCTHDESLGMYCSTGACSGTDAATDGNLGCGKTGSPTGTLSNQSVTVAGQRRTYLLQVPTTYKSTTPNMLIFAWHGSNSDGAQARTQFRLETKSGDSAIFIYPNGAAGSDPWDLSTDGSDVQFFEAMLGAVSSNYCVDTNRVFTTGYGMGAYLTNVLGCYRGDTIRAIAPVAGGGPPDMLTRPCTTRVAAMVVHGRNDSVVPLAVGQLARDFLYPFNGCSSQTTAYSAEPACSAYQGCSPDLPVVWCPHDEGHAWPNLASDCTTGVCLDAGPTIWTFFSTFH